MGILICGLNGTGKSTLGRLLADRMGYEFIDNEDLFFPKTDPSYTFSGPRSKEEVIRLLEERISRNNRFIFAAVKGDYGDRLIASLECIVLIEVPKQIRSKRVRDRSYQKFGDRILPGGDLYDQESKWFSLTDSRPETYVTDWLETVHCSVVRIDGTRPVEENADDLMPVLSKGTNDERGSEEDCGHISCAEDEKMLDYRLMTIEDYEAAYDLWIRCGNGLNDKDDSREGIEKYLKRNPDTSYVAVLDGKVVGVILCGHDGRRGIIQHACVSPDCRRMGIGKKLVDLALDALKKEGINKVLLVAFKKNESGNAFWESQGFTLREDLNYRNKALAEMVRIDPDYLKG